MDKQGALEQELQSARQEIEKLKADIKSANQLYVDMFEAAGDSIFIVDLDSDEIIACNGHAARRLGYSRGALLGKLYDEIEYVDKNDSSDGMVYESQFSRTNVYECEHIHKDGHHVPVEVSSRIVEWDGRTVFMNFVRNIALRKEAQQREIEFTLERERMELLTRFIQNAGHEFRTPLSIVKTSVYLMRKSDNPASQESHANKIMKQVDRISEFVNTMLLVTKLETEQMPLDQAVDIVQLLKSLIADCQSKYGDEPTIQLSAPPQLPNIVGNMSYLIEAFQQILINAYQFTPLDKTIRLSAQIQGDMIQVVIADEGDGIQPDTLPHIFELFWREDQAQTTAGFGLGLPIASLIIEQHHGSIDVSSEVGQGSQFIIQLPIVQ